MLLQLDFNDFLTIGTVIATLTFVTSGVAAAFRKEFDIVGALVLACVCALGGGTVRDILIGADPVFWSTDPIYMSTIVPGTLIAILLIHNIPPGKGILWRILDITDAMGLALFSILGAQKAFAFGLPAYSAVIMGLITGVFGGILRDVLTQETPLVFRGQIYAIAAIAGAILYSILRLYTDEAIAMVSGMICIFTLRLIARFADWRVPLKRHNT